MAAYVLTQSTAQALTDMIKERHALHPSVVGQTQRTDGEPLELPLEPTVWKVDFSTTQESYLIFLGDKPLSVSGTYITPEGVTEAEAPLDGSGWYSLDGFEDGDLHLLIDTTQKRAKLAASSETGYDLDVVVATVSVDDETEAVTVHQHLTGALILAGGGGGGKYVSVFEPYFTDGVLDGVMSGLYPFGRQFYSAVTVDDSAKVATGFIVLEVDHGYGVPSATIKLRGEAMADIVNTDTTKTVLPLYELQNGAISIDCRPLLALAMRE